MDECCRVLHAKLISGLCPWCGQTINSGQVVGSLSSQFESIIAQRHAVDNSSIKTIVLSHGPIAPKTAVKYVLGAASQLQMHFSSKPHSNISPDSMYVDVEGNILLSPPYIREEHEMSLSIEENDICVADYLAPEQALNSYKADQRSDIYSLGCLMFYMLTAKPPFQGQSISEVLLKHQNESPTSPHTINPQVPESLTNICLKMLAKKPVERYQTMLELRTALIIWLDE